MKIKITNRTIFLLIFIVAIFLRFYNYFNIPFTHDEFSAIFRLNFNSFSELIEKGVKIDGHPAGIQVFLYYWTKLFGFDEWVVKLPFTIFGILSVLLIYLIGRKWFNETVGLLSASFLASIQFTIMYSQIARPYISGLFFSLLMVYYWTNLIKTPKKNFYLNSILFIISASLCTYNHHFSLLFAAIVGISGLFFIQKEYLIKYIISGILIFILYLPHLKIFLYQLNMGGIEGWLAKPHNDFIIKYIEYIFHFSALTIIVTIGIIAFGIKGNSLKKINYKHYILFFTWFILPFLIGFFYSKYVSAVLQYSMLIFSLPYLFFILFGHIKPQKTYINFILVLTILTVNVFTLIANRNHYTLFYQSPYLEILNDFQKEKQISSKKILFIIDSHKKITRYYSLKLDIDTDFIWYDSFKNIKKFKVFLENQSKLYDNLFLGCLSSNNPLTVPVVQDYYPKIVWQKNYVGGTTFLFSKTTGNTSKTISLLDFESPNNKFWSSIKPSNIIDSVKYSGQKSYLIDSISEFGPTYSEKLQNIISNKNNFIDISVKAKAIDKLNGIVLVATLEHNGKSIYWRGINFDNFIEDSLNSRWETVHCSIKLSDVYQEYNNIILKIYIWNKNKRNFIIDDFEIRLRKGNPIIYGLNEEL